MPKNVGKILKEGMLGGVAAYLSVVAVLAFLNALQGRSVLYTAAAMGAVLFYGADASTQFAVEPAPVLAYNGVHLVGSLAVGLVAAVQVYESEHHRFFWYFSLMILIVATVYSVTVFGVFGVEIGRVLDWPEVLLGTAAWVGSMTGYFWWLHRGLIRRMREDTELEL